MHGDQRDSLAYSYVKYAFSVATGVFFAKVEISGKEHVPERGEAMLLCYNHVSVHCAALR